MATSRERGGTNQGTAQDTQGDQTKKWGKGVVMRLPKGENRDYLCAHICVASKTTEVDSKGRSLKQNTCTEAIRAEEKLAELVWAYKAEVGYRIRDNPPTPIMSAEDPHRASTWPLVRMKQEVRGSTKGLFKIPDCIVLNVTDAELLDMRMRGVADWSKLIKSNASKYGIKSYKFFDLRSIPGDKGNGWIVHDDFNSARSPISINGRHVIAVIDGEVFDNHHPKGAVKNVWDSKLHNQSGTYPKGFTTTSIPNVSKIE